MTQSVLIFPPARAGALRAFLEARGFVQREAQNALFAAKGDGLTVTLYRTGKLLVQGPTAAAFASEKLAHLAAGDGAAPPSAKKRAPRRTKAKSEAPPPASGLLIGSDEAGKGDYFGPLVVAAVALDEEGAERFRSMGVRDGKTLADPTVLSLDGLIRAEAPFELVALDPEEYNRRHKAIANLNTLLASLHVDALASLAARTGATRALTDQFANPRVMEDEARRRGLAIDLRQRTRAESETAVAAASIVARAEFLRRLDALRAVAGMRLPKGASREAEDGARELFRRGGREALARVAKMHFKTTAKVTGTGLFDRPAPDEDE